MLGWSSKVGVGSCRGAGAEQARRAGTEPSKARPGKRGILDPEKSEPITPKAPRFWAPRECQHKAHRGPDTRGDWLEISSKNKEQI